MEYRRIEKPSGEFVLVAAGMLAEDTLDRWAAGAPLKEQLAPIYDTRPFQDDPKYEGAITPDGQLHRSPSKKQSSY